MKHLKTFESLHPITISSLINELKDMALELTDLGYNVQVSNEKYVGVYSTLDYFIVVIRRGDKFTMTNDVKDFLFRSIGYMKDKGYKYDTHSNYGRLYFTEDDRIIISSGEAREKYPSFTMIKISFKNK